MAGHHPTDDLPIAALEAADRLFDEAETHTRNKRYDDAVKSYRAFVRAASGIDDKFTEPRGSECCPYCHEPPTWGLIEPPIGDRPCCSPCWSRLHRLDRVHPDELDALQAIAIQTAANLQKGDAGLDWLSDPPAEHPHFLTDEQPEIDLSAREVALKLVALSQELGHRPTPRDAQESGSLNPRDVFDAFGTWDDALDAAGLGA